MQKIDIDTIKKLLPERPKNSNKGTFGKVLNIAGCYNYQGAAYFSSLTPLKVGAGLVTLATTKQVINNLSGALPWVTFFPLDNHNNVCISKNAFSDLSKIIDDYDVISVGPGLSTNNNVCLFLEDLINYLSHLDKKIVFDADALNIIAKSKIEKLPQNSIITPHPMEMSRLLNVPINDIQNNRCAYAKQAAKDFGCIAVLKGNETIVAKPTGECWQNTTGNSSLAKAGSGDVLTGMIAGFLAQKLTPLNASLISVYLHGLCGELASEKLTEYSVMATDQIDFIPMAIETILHTNH